MESDGVEYPPSDNNSPDRPRYNDFEIVQHSTNNNPAYGVDTVPETPPHPTGQ